MSYCHSAPSVVRPSVRPSVRRKLSHFRLLLWNRWTEFNETWQKARSQSPLPSLCFSSRSKKQDGRPGLWLAETFSTSSLKPLNRIQQNLTGSKISKPSTKFVFFGPIRKTRWPPWPLIGWDIFDFSSETAERNSTKLDRKQDLNALYQVFVFRADRKKKMAALASDWLRHFRLLLWNRWTEFNETWQEARSQRPLPSLCFSGWSEKQDGRLASDWLRYFRLLLWNCWMEFNETWQESRSKRPLLSLCFSGRSEKQDGRPGLWLAETFSTSPLKPLNRIKKWNMIGSKISTPSTKFVFFGQIGKMAALASDWLRYFWLLLGNWERNLTKLDRKQDLKALYQVYVFHVDRKNKMAALASDLPRHFQLFLWNGWKEFNKTWQEARSQHRIPGLRFSGWSEKQDSRPVLWLAETFLISPMKPLKGIQRNLTESKFSTSSTKFLFFWLIQKTIWPPWPLIGWDIFWLFLWNRWTEFSKTWQEARS